MVLFDATNLSTFLITLLVLLEMPEEERGSAAEKATRPVKLVVWHDEYEANVSNNERPGDVEEPTGNEACYRASKAN